MTDIGAPMLQGPLVMGMTPSEYQAAFAYLDHANFAREIDEYEARQNRHQGQVAGSPISWIQRPEVWALILGLVTLCHSVFVQWLWPIILREMPRKSPYLPEISST
ncbi:hypothetical protein GGR55DRAFT_673805 [Xylaria sp. FL0064]|nr:hypothetical protein GGR55DRAFT_673805 [Xylaria sp. FL0064]